MQTKYRIEILRKNGNWYGYNEEWNSQAAAETEARDILRRNKHRDDFLAITEIAIYAVAPSQIGWLTQADVI